MQADDYKRRVQDFIASLASLSSGQPSAYLADDVILWVLGQTRLSGTYRGITEVGEVFVDTVTKRLANFSVEVIKIVASGNDVAVQAAVTATTKAGGIYNPGKGPDLIYFQLKGDRIVEIRWFPNTADIQAVFDGAAPGANA